MQCLAAQEAKLHKVTQETTLKRENRMLSGGGSGKGRGKEHTVQKQLQINDEVQKLMVRATLYVMFQFCTWFKTCFVCF